MGTTNYNQNGGVKLHKLKDNNRVVEKRETREEEKRDRKGKRGKEGQRRKRDK